MSLFRISLFFYHMTVSRDVVLYHHFRYFCIDHFTLYLTTLYRNLPYHTVLSPTIHGSVRLEKMVKCRIFLGPCCTSVYIEECSEIEVFLACHQLRIHKSHNCKLFVRANSHPIIEDCTGFGFAPYNITYDSINDDFKVRTCSCSFTCVCVHLYNSPYK